MRDDLGMVEARSILARDLSSEAGNNAYVHAATDESAWWFA